MTLRAFKCQSVSGRRECAENALTIVELMVTMVVFGLTIVALIYSNLYGMRQDELVNSKLGASDSSRRGFEVLMRDVRSAKIWLLGNGNLSSFTPVANGSAQQGNALKVCLSTDTNTYILYYFDTSARQLRRGHSGAGATKMIAQNLTNAMYFRAEDYRGVMQYDLSHKDVIHVWMEFAQFQYPMTKVGPGYYYDYYKMEFRLTSHVPDGP